MAAVGERTFALVRRRDDREVNILLDQGRLTGRTTPLGIRWEAVTPPFAVAARAADVAVAIHGVEITGFDLALSKSAAPSGMKLGMGGSARAAVLTTESVRYIIEAKFDSLKVALVSHYLSQNRAGSGGDVAAVFAGGIIRYRRYAVSSIADALPRGTARMALTPSLPVDLWRLPKPRVYLTYVFTGQSSDSMSLISAVEGRLNEREREAFVHASEQGGEALERALLRNDFDLLRQSTRELQRLLASIRLATEAIEDILAIANAHGGAGKISGAGVGDGCILFSADPDAQRHLIASLRARDYLAQPLTVEAGLQGEAVAPPFLHSWLG